MMLTFFAVDNLFEEVVCAHLYIIANQYRVFIFM